ncbi:MAG TPA: L-seryl-tRNA(Sec) selenium transferase [Beutenbergiaceae bacterium]|nr:L-seryl-tRNA(Sec) selenium transferase [Beutenbergiaceae bacterium]
MSDPRRQTPRTDAVLAAPELVEAAQRLGPALVKDAARQAIEQCRAGQVAPADVVAAAVGLLPAAATSLRRVVNASGVLVHTNLGRAPLSAAAIAALEVAATTNDVELDLASGARGPRGSGALAALARAVPDAGGVHVVNNGAAALALVTLGLAAGRTMVIARGELVEIGDGFRIPELLESVGGRLREVGTTNRVHLTDYAEAIDDETALVLKVHPSNFRLSGFTSTVSVEALATLPVPVVADIGSGLLAPHPRLPQEPSAAGMLRAGAALVTASGDKLLGGPQCGLMLGDEHLVRSLRRHPFARAVRVDKLTLAALEATVIGPAPPVRAGLETTAEELLQRADTIVTALPEELAARAVPSTGAVGGGGAPGVELPSAAIAVAEHYAQPLRTGRPSVLGRLHQGKLLLDLLAVPPEQDRVLIEALRRAAR